MLPCCDRVLIDWRSLVLRLTCGRLSVRLTWRLLLRVIDALRLSLLRLLIDVPRLDD
jgi:hypothetical protein